MYSVPDRGSTEMKQMPLLSKSLIQWEENPRQTAVSVKGTLQEVLCSALKRKRSAHFKKS